jgi:virulence factor Mce-like protein
MSPTSTTIRARLARHRLVAAVVMLLVALAAASAAVVQLVGGGGTYTVTVQFVHAPGLYTSNSVTVLGVPSGEVESVTPHADRVDVVLSLPDRVRLPQGVRAVLMAPNPVSDRSVELFPPYTGGATLPHGATVPLERTAVPLELDDVYRSVDQLSRALGPAGANKGGELSAALHALAQLADGNGQDVHNAIDAIAAALPALTAHPDDLTHFIDGIDQLTSTLASRNSTINALYRNLSGATAELADERQEIATAVTNLQQGLQAVAQFIKAHQDAITGSISHLSSIMQAIIAEQQELIRTFDVAPLGFQNFNRAIDPNVPCAGKAGSCPALFGRLDLTSDAAQIVKTYCGNVLYSVAGMLENSANLPGGAPVQTLCAAEIGLTQGRSGAPQAPHSPDLDLTHYLGNR